MDIYSPPGHLAGTLEQIWSKYPRFNVKDVDGNIVLKIEGPFCSCACTWPSVDFKVIKCLFNLVLIHNLNYLMGQ